MIDAADQAAADDARAMELFEQQLRTAARVAESFRPMTPDAMMRCHDCGNLIGEARLRAYPRASRCTPCAAAVEARGFG